MTSTPPRVITTSRDRYGLDADGLRDRLVAITGTQTGADDALAAVAEWLDTAKYRAHKLAKKATGTFAAKTRSKKRVRLRGKIRRETVRTGATAALLVERLSGQIERRVTDSEYVRIETDGGVIVRRRILKEIGA